MTRLWERVEHVLAVAPLDEEHAVEDVGGCCRCGRPPGSLGDDIWVAFAVVEGEGRRAMTVCSSCVEVITLPADD